MAYKANILVSHFGKFHKKGKENELAYVLPG